MPPIHGGVRTHAPAAPIPADAQTDVSINDFHALLNEMRQELAKEEEAQKPPPKPTPSKADAALTMLAAINAESVPVRGATPRHTPSRPLHSHPHPHPHPHSNAPAGAAFVLQPNGTLAPPHPNNKTSSPTRRQATISEVIQGSETAALQTQLKRLMQPRATPTHQDSTASSQDGGVHPAQKLHTDALLVDVDKLVEERSSRSNRVARVDLATLSGAPRLPGLSLPPVILPRQPPAPSPTHISPRQAEPSPTKPRRVSISALHVEADAIAVLHGDSAQRLSPDGERASTGSTRMRPAHSSGLGDAHLPAVKEATPPPLPPLPPAGQAKQGEGNKSPTRRPAAPASKRWNL